ncbi:MAG TPA: helicase [Ruminococcaceae bacterium]|nr:helicase [Oscillospiraceae bacterium]
MSDITIIPFPDEIARLEKISRDIDNALANAEANVGRLDKEYMDMKRYMVQNRGEIDPHEMFQNELGLRQIDHTGAFAATVLDKTAKLKESPYFARIDFRHEAADKADIFYIGRFAFSHEGELLISDWRSPVASMFYDHEIGSAGYIAPAGRINGELTRKRQFKIKNGVMEYALESSINIQDNILQQELSHTSDEHMNSIIATIQKEQNIIIRNEKAGTMIIQGVAGSGKTSIALHRIAFLLYRRGNRLTAKNVAILSPNKVFGDYISGVLPELGEEPIGEISLIDIAEVQLEGVIGFEADKDPLTAHDAAWVERVRYKSTLDFVKMLVEFVEQIPDIAFKPIDYTHGRFTANAEMIRERFRAYSKYPVKRRLQMTADDIYDRFYTDNFMEDDIPGSKTILKALNKMLTFKNTLALYKEFYKQNVISQMFVMPAKNTLEWADIYPFLYVHAAFEGLQKSGVIKHLVVDEMQDYTPVQYAVLNVLFKCQKTILGDFGQFLNPNHLHTLEDLKQLYHDAEYAELTKSYRSTHEIISFAKKLGQAEKIEAVERHGEMPAMINCRDFNDELANIRERIDAFAKSAYVSLGIIAKTDEDAKCIFDLLSVDYDVHLISKGSTRFVNGVTVTSIQMSKGLEFDEVIIPDVNVDKYSSEYERGLLYIACTRAMHKLTLLWAGKVSALIKAT